VAAAEAVACGARHGYARTLKFVQAKYLDRRYGNPVNRYLRSSSGPKVTTDAHSDSSRYPPFRYCGKHHTLLMLQSRSSIASYSLLIAARSAVPTNWTMYP
jgi:hypothetical protein